MKAKMPEFTKVKGWREPRKLFCKNGHKVCFISEEDARKARRDMINATRRGFSRFDKAENLKAYQCPHCGFFHLGRDKYAPKEQE